MNPIILNHFQDYLNEHSFSKGTIRDYLRCVSNLDQLDHPAYEKNEASIEDVG